MKLPFQAQDGNKNAKVFQSNVKNILREFIGNEELSKSVVYMGA